MRLSTRHKSIVYELLAIGTRPREILKKVNKLFEGEIALKPFESNNLAFYQNQFKKLSPEEQVEYLPYSLKTSFALQQTRINDDIRDLGILNQQLDKFDEAEGENKDILDIIETKAKIKNRISQELGQALAWTKGGPGTNINILQMMQKNFQVIIGKASRLKPEERLELLRKVGQMEEASEQGRPEINP